MRRVLRRAAQREPVPDPGDVWGWLDFYKRAVRAADYEEAACIGERLLDFGFDLRVINVLRWPRFDTHFQYHRLPRAYWDSMRRPLMRFVIDNPRSPWGGFFLRWFLPRGSGAAARLRRKANAERLRAFPLKRYGWMRAELGKDQLIAGEFRSALADYRAALECFPEDWPSRFFLGEALLCLGHARRAQAVFNGALKSAGTRDFAEAAAWRGEMYLWTGDYSRALSVLDKACSASAREACVWKAGALLKLGRHSLARSILEAELRRQPGDLEAVIWLAESLWRLGRPKDALRALQRAESAGGHLYRTFIRTVRALTFDEMGMRRARDREFKAIPVDVLNFVRRRWGKRSLDRRQTLESILDLSRGVRRDGYERAAWTR